MSYFLTITALLRYSYKGPAKDPNVMLKRNSSKGKNPIDTGVKFDLLHQFMLSGDIKIQILNTDT